MAEKSIKARVIQKHDIEENWLKATNFIPKQGELIIYDKDDTYDIERFKIGDGTTNVNDLPFRSIDGGYDGLTEILPETTLTFTDSRTLTFTDCPLIEGGIKYIVTFYNPEIATPENNEYELIGQSTVDSGPTYIGNAKHSWGGVDTGEPFIIYNFSSSKVPTISISSAITLPCTYNIKIKAIAPVKIDEKYLDIKNTNIVNGSAKGSLRTIGSATEGSEYEIRNNAFAEGNGTKASGVASHAEGNYTTASGEASHAEGGSTKASGSNSHAEGGSTKASGSASHAEGNSTTALSDYSHAEGNSTVAGQRGFKVTACEKLTDTTGTYTLTSVTGLSKYQRYSVHLSSSKEDCGMITAVDTTNKKITVDGYPDIALSSSSSSTANYLTIVNNPKLGDIFVSGRYSHAEGYDAQASGDDSHAEGSGTKASGRNSHAEGGSTKASGRNSHAEGVGTTASSAEQHVQGQFNIEDSNDIYADIIGNGSYSKRSNAATVDWNGNAWYAGNVYVGSTSGTNKDEGSKKLATEEYVNSVISSSGGSGIVVDYELSSTSVNPVQNKVINTALGTKVDKVSGKGLSTNDYTSADKTKLSGIESEANKTVVDTALSDTSENPVQNKVIKSYIDAQLVAITTDEIDSICV